MLMELMREEDLFFQSKSHNLEESLDYLIGELPGWKFTHKHRQGLRDILSQSPEAKIERICEGVSYLPVEFDGVSLPVIVWMIFPEGLQLQKSGRWIHVLNFSVIPNSQHSGMVRERIKSEAKQFFESRFLVERLRLCENAGEAFDFFYRNSDEDARLQRISA